MLVAESGREGGRGEEDEIRKAMGQCFPFVTLSSIGHEMSRTPDENVNA